VPVGLPYLEDSLESYLDMTDGVVLPGGMYSFPASYYNDTPEQLEPLHPRVAFEMGFTRRVLARNLPLLGICAGMQVMAAVMGAMILRDVQAAYTTTIDHLNEKPAEEFAHVVSIAPDTLLHRITGLSEMQVNTAHRESIVDMPDAPGLVINARAPDGVIEGLEITGKRFALGVQWHPEFFLDAGNPHLALFEALIESAGGTSMAETTTGRVA
jgi:putative glutamine amidotransferase